MEQAPEGIVVALVAPGLGQVLQLHVGGRPQSHRGPAHLDFGPPEVIPDDGQVRVPERQIALAAQLPQGLERGEVEDRHLRGVRQLYPGQDDTHSCFRVPILPGKDPELLDHVVGQQFPGHLGRAVAIQTLPEKRKSLEV